MKHPETQEQIGEIRWTIRQTQITDRLRTSINNLYRQFLNPTAERCTSNGCGKLKKYQDELNRWYTLNHHKWNVIQEEKKSVEQEYQEGKISVEEATDQVKKLKKYELLDLVRTFHPKQVNRAKQEGDLVYVNGRKKAEYRIDSDNKLTTND